MAAAGAVTAGRRDAHVHSVVSSAESRVCDQLGEEHVVTCSGGEFSGAVPELSHVQWSNRSGPAMGGPLRTCLRRVRMCVLQEILFSVRVSTHLAAQSTLHVSSPSPDSPDSHQSDGAWSLTDPDHPKLACKALVHGNLSACSCPAVANVGICCHRQRGRFFIYTQSASCCGLGWLNLSRSGLSPHVIHTLQSAQASSPRSLCDCKWRVFKNWCSRNGHISFQCLVGVILSFLQDLTDKHRAFSMIKIYLTAIAICHVGFRELTASQHLLGRRFMNGA